MQENTFFSVQKWLPFEEIYENGIIKLKNKTYIKIIKISPINYNLKSNLEKEAILDSYKTFLKTCNFDIQILIQSKKEDLSKHISKIKKLTNEENEKTKIFAEKYLKYIEEKNRNSKSSSKNYYIIIQQKEEKNQNKDKNFLKKLYSDKLNEQYFKIKECLARCGNIAYEINESEEVKNILFSFLNTRKDLIN